MGDVDLLVSNCFAYNPPGHWIRPLAQSLSQMLREEAVKEGPWLKELERFLKQVCIKII